MDAIVLRVKFKSLIAAASVVSSADSINSVNDKSTEFNWANLVNKLVVVARVMSLWKSDGGWLKVLWLNCYRWGWECQVASLGDRWGGFRRGPRYPVLQKRTWRWLQYCRYPLKVNNYTVKGKGREGRGIQQWSKQKRRWRQHLRKFVGIFTHDPWLGSASDLNVTVEIICQMIIKKIKFNPFCSRNAGKWWLTVQDGNNIFRQGIRDKSVEDRLENSLIKCSEFVVV